MKRLPAMIFVIVCFSACHTKTDYEKIFNDSDPILQYGS